jgi:hypothetical protein
MLCQKCGNDIAETAKFCGKCGEAITHVPPVADAGSSSADAGKSGLLAGVLIVVLIAAVASWFVFNKSEPASETAQVTLEESGAGTPSKAVESSPPVQEAAQEAAQTQTSEEEAQATPPVASTSASSASAGAPQKPAQAAVKERQVKPAAAPQAVDAVYSERSKECAQGVSGFFCRESLRIALCKGHWSEHPPEWGKLCKLNEQNK